MSDSQDTTDLSSPKTLFNRQMHLMAEARSRTSFDPREVSALIHGGVANLKKREAAFARVEAALGTNDISKLPLRYANMDRVQTYHEGLATGKVLIEEQIAHQHGVFDRTTQYYTLINESPFGLHPCMFIPTLKLQASDEQLSYWLPMAESGRIIGTYCQTEVGHGTFVRGLETTATFDELTDEFIIHSPTITSTKYWPGGLGFSSSHAIVMARLIIQNKDYDIHPFVVQLRSLDDYTPMPGIELGDIGLKYGLNQNDNGYAIFHHIRIPRTQLLMRNAQVLPDGTYVKAPHGKLAYATMILSRSQIIYGVAFQLAQAATIATRYSVVREQGANQGGLGAEELPILSYKSQHLRLLTHMSRAFALAFTYQACERLYYDMVAAQSQGDHRGLAYGHGTIASLKAYATQIAADSAEDCRKCCGGHGYSLLSGIPDIVMTVTSAATLEGENYVMYQQAARYLVKTVTSIRYGLSIDAPMQYLAEGYKTMYPHLSAEEYAHLVQPASPSYDHTDFHSLESQIDIIRARTVRIIFESESIFRETRSRTEVSIHESWNMHMMTLIAAARAHAELFAVRSFASTLSSSHSLSISSRNVLWRLYTLYALDSITSPSSLSPSFLEHTSLSVQNLKQMRSVIDDTLSALLPQAIGITDAWGFTDASLRSALGLRNGNVYETLMAWTKQIPINKMARTDGNVEKIGYQRYTQRMLRSKM